MVRVGPILAATLVIVAVIITMPLVTVLMLTDAKTGTPAAYVKVVDGQEFAISFTHSVNKRPVQDFIRINGDRFVVEKSVYDAFGAGMPEHSSDGATLTTRADGKLELANINRPLPEFTLFAGTVAGHVLHINSRDYPLADLVEPGTPLLFKITKISLITLLGGRFLP